MADENMTNDTNVQQNGKKITVKLKPLALEKATGEQAAAPAAINIPVAPAGADAAATVKFNHKAVAASEPEMPSAQDLAKQTIKLAPPPRTGLPKPPAPMPSVAPAATQAVPVQPRVMPVPAPAATQAVPVQPAAPTPAVAPVAPAADATQAVKKPGLTLQPKTPVAPTPAVAPVAPAADATQAVKKPGLSLPGKAPAAPTPAVAPVAPAADATQAVKKPGLSLPGKAPAAPAAPTPAVAPAVGGALKLSPTPTAPTAPAAPVAEEDPEAAAKRVQSEGLKPKEGGSGLGLKKVAQVAEEELPENLKADGKKLVEPSIDNSIEVKSKGGEPGGVIKTCMVLALILLLIGVYVMFAQYSKHWMPEMDEHADKIPQPPTGIFVK